MATTILLTRIEEAIQSAKPEEQWRFAVDFALLKAAEHSFDFWDNTDDAIYDALQVG